MLTLTNRNVTLTIRIRPDRPAKKAIGIDSMLDTVMQGVRGWGKIKLKIKPKKNITNRRKNPTNYDGTS